MGDIGKGNQATSYPTSLDTNTSLSNCGGTPCIGGDAVVAGYINNPVGAIVAIETALGITPQGTAATVAARLAIMLANDGGMPRGTVFPASPVNVPQLFYRTDQNLLYYYNTSTGAWVQFLTTSALSAYVPIASPVAITAQHTFNPPIAEAPFILGANAQGQLVTGLNADQLEGLKPAVANGIATLDGSSHVVQAGAVNPVTAGQPSGVATLDGSSLVVQNPTNATATPTPSKIPIADASGLLIAWVGGFSPGVNQTIPTGVSAYIAGGAYNITGSFSLSIQGTATFEVG